MEKTQLIKVKNRSAGLVVYSIPEDNIRRIFASGEEKKIQLGELEKLTYQAGGKELIANYLQLTDPRATEELNVHTEPEYWMNEEQILDLLQSGSQEQFLDALDFAPQGVIDLIKDLAVKIRLNDFNKREAIKAKTGFDVSAALAHIEEEKAEDNTSEVQQAKRRVQPAEDTTETARRTTPRTYNVVTK